MALNDEGFVSVLGLKSVEGSMIGSYCICEGVSRLILILSMFFNGLVLVSVWIGSGIGILGRSSTLAGDFAGDVGCGDCACVNVLIRCAITELRTGFSGVAVLVL